jgi:hypothetical protein
MPKTHKCWLIISSYSLERLLPGYRRQQSLKGELLRPLVAGQTQATMISRLD